MKLIIFAVALTLAALPAEAARKKQRSHKGYDSYAAQPRIACTPCGMHADSSRLLPGARAHVRRRS
jgi:hypothetical protein